MHLNGCSGHFVEISLISFFIFLFSSQKYFDCEEICFPGATVGFE